MKISLPTLNILTAKTFKDIGNAWIYDNLALPLCTESIVERLQTKAKDYVDDAIFDQKQEQIDRQLQQLEKYCDGVIGLGDKDFPFIRGKTVNSGDQPTVLFYKGDLSLLNSTYHNIAVIGLLNPDKQIERDERKIVSALVKQGAVIVSGLAQGCDEIAHDETLLSGGKTVAILPSPLNQILPRKNIELANRIIEQGGLIITEYYEPFKTNRELSTRYIQRDRLQALFSDCVLLAASYTPNSISMDRNPKVDSGARHAMGKAKKYKLKRAVMYHSRYDDYTMFDLNRAIMNDVPEPDVPAPIVVNPDEAQHIYDEIFSQHTTSFSKSPVQENLL